MSSPAIGIDLGTTNSVVAVSINGKPQVLVDPVSNSPLIPSVVSFTEKGERLVGKAARSRKAFDPANTVSSVKRLLGRPFKSEEVRRAKSRVSFDLKEGADSAVLVQTRAGSFSLPEISAMVLREVRRVAEETLEQRIDRCVVTVPANFNELQRSSTKIAGKIAELDVVRILNEPTAAALAYGYGRGTREKICIYDFGGGTFDVTLLELNGNVFEVLATWGDTFLGGDDIDIAITDSLVTHLTRATRVDASTDRLAYDILRDSVEFAKCALSQAESAPVDFNYMPPGGAPVRFTHSLPRAELDRLAGPFIEKTFSVCQEALKLAGLRPSDLTAVILVGGSTRIHSVRSKVTQFFGREPLTHLPPEEVVGLGASILAEALTGGVRKSPTTRQMTAGSTTSTGAAAGSISVPGAPMSATGTNPRGQTLTGQGPQVSSPMRAPTPPPMPGALVRPPAPPAVPTAGRGQSAAAPIALNRPLSPAVSPRALTPPLAHSPVSFDLDEPFAPSVGERTVSTPMKATPMPRQAPDADDLDEPSFIGRLPPGSGGAKPASPGRVDAPVSAFDLNDASMAGPLPRGAAARNGVGAHAELPANAPELPASAPELPARSVPMPKPPIGARPSSPNVAALNVKPPIGARPSPMSTPAVDDATRPVAFASTLAALPPSIAAAIRPPPPRGASAAMFPESSEQTKAMDAVGELSVPSFRIDASSLFGDEPKPPSSGADIDLSVPSFRIDADDIFGPSGEVGSGTLVAKSPFDATVPEEETTRAAQPPPVPPPVPLPISLPPSDLEDDTHTQQFKPFAQPLPPISDESTRVIQTPFSEDNAELPPMVVPAAVKAPVPVVRPSVAPPQPVAFPFSSTMQQGSSSVSGDANRPSLPPGTSPSSPSFMPTPSTPPMPNMGSSSAPPRLSMGTGGIAVPLLLDVTPLSLGVETAGGLCEAVIRRNSTIPVEQTRVFATTNDDQTSVVIRIAQGESRKYSENQLLGELELTGLRAAPRGEVSVGVTFELSADGTLNVRARDVESGREQATRVSLLTLPSESAQAEMAARQRQTAAT